jgi:ATP-dependent DNA helicase 2 subunit 2
MADKEATVYVVDVGKSMGEQKNGRSISDLDWAMQYVWDKITTTVSVHTWPMQHIAFRNNRRLEGFDRPKNSNYWCSWVENRP